MKCVLSFLLCTSLATLCLGATAQLQVVAGDLTPGSTVTLALTADFDALAVGIRLVTDDAPYTPVDQTGAMEISVGLTIAPPMIAGLTVTNDFSIINDGMGFLGYTDSTPPAIFGEFMNQITNDLEVDYDLMVGDSVACTFFGKLMYEQIVPVTEGGSIFTLDPLATVFTEQASKATIGYELGVKATVSF